MREDDFIGQKFYWFTGEVKDIADPESFNRVRVFCHGYHPDELREKNNKEHLPWATVMMPTTSAGIQDVGANHHLEEGSWVVGFFRDGASAQDPIVMGSITTSTTVGNNQIYDLHSSASTTNKIYRSNAGHLIELENESGNETIQVTHAKGAKITIDADNNLTIDVKEGDTSITTGGDTKIKTIGKTNIDSDEEITIISKVKTIII